MNTYEKIHQFSFSNGIRALCVSTTLPISSVSIWFDAGSRFDPVGKEGLAHFFEHFYASRTKRFNTANDFSKELARHGITRNASTNREMAFYYHEQPTEKTLESLGYLLEAVNYYKVSEKDIERERTVIQNELGRRNADPNKYIAYMNHCSLWPDRFSRSVLGSRISLEKISLTDCLKFKESYYIPERTSIIVASSIDPEKIKSYLENIYGSSTEPPKKEPVNENQISEPAKIIVIEREVPQTYLSINFQTIPEKEFKTATILDFLCNYYLTNSWSSLLVQKLRFEKGLTYWINGSSVFYRDRGYMSIQFSVDPKYINESIGSVIEVIKEMRNGNIKKDNIEISKGLINYDYLKEGISVYNIINWYGWQMICGNQIHDRQEDFEIKSALTSEQIRQTADAYLTKENMTITAICRENKKELENQLQKLKELS